MAQPLKWLVLPPLGLALATALWPVAGGVLLVLDDAAARAEWLEYYTGDRIGLLGRSLLLPLAVTLGALLLALLAGAAWFFGGRGCRRALGAALFIPLWVHPMVLVFGLMILLRQGPVADAVDLAFLWAGPHGGSWGSVIGIMVLLLHPLAGWPAILALQRVPQVLIASARNQGAGPWRLYCDVLLPAQREALWAGAALVYLQGAGFFVVPVLLGDGWVNTLPVLLADRLDAGMGTGAWVMALALLGPLWLFAIAVLPALVRSSLWGE